MVVGAVEEGFAEDGEDRLAEDLAEKRPAFLRQSRLAAIRAALALPQVEAGVAQKGASRAEVRERAGLASQAGEVEERDALQVVEFGKLAVSYELASDRLNPGPEALSTGRKALIVGPEGLQSACE